MVLRAQRFVQRDERGAYLGKVLAAAVDHVPRAPRRPKVHPQPNRLMERVEYAEERLRLFRRAVLIDRHAHVLIRQDGRGVGECREQVEDYVEQVVRVDQRVLLAVVGGKPSRG